MGWLGLIFVLICTLFISPNVLEKKAFKYHWFLVVFHYAESNIAVPHSVTKSFYIPRDRKYVTTSEIERIKISNPELIDSTVINIAYLGYCTIEEFMP